MKYKSRKRMRSNCVRGERYPDMEYIGCVFLTDFVIGPFWYRVYKGKDGNIFFDTGWGLEPYIEEQHGRIFTEEEIKELEAGGSVP